MITTSIEIVWNILKDGFAVMLHPDRFTVDGARRTHDLAAEILADRLMSETNTKDRDLSRKTFNCFQSNSGVVRCSRAR